jgi:hypothetical protein
MVMGELWLLWDARPQELAKVFHRARAALALERQTEPHNTNTPYEMT